MEAKIKINSEKIKGKVSPMIFGQFIEHMGRAIYGGVYEPDNSLSDKNGFRLDVIEKIKELNPPILRWPGGNFSSGYHWIDGIGPKNKRQPKMELAWETIESNQFGTHEFMQLCDYIKTEPYFAVNLGWGTSEEAVNWLEYCNSDTNTYFANLRKQNGSEKPFNVKYWGLGNEIYGPWQHGHCEPEEYAAKAAETAKMMKRLGPEIHFIFCGANNSEWDRKVLEHLYKKGFGPLIDYISLHRYDGCPGYYKTLLNTIDFERNIKGLEGIINMIENQYPGTNIPGIAVDEWNIWYRKSCDRTIAKKYFRQGEDLLEEFYNLTDALYVASVLNIFIRHANSIKMANMAQLINVIAPIYTTPKGSYYQPIFFPMKYYRLLHNEIALDIRVESEILKPDINLEKEEKEKYQKYLPPHWENSDNVWKWPNHWFNNNFSYIDAAGTISADKKNISISIVNRHKDNDCNIKIEICGSIQTQNCNTILITGDNPMESMLIASGNNINQTIYKPEICIIKEEKNINNNKIFKIPAHSILIINYH
jgi:alpha-N-arabinofuranosidase